MNRPRMTLEERRAYLRDLRAERAEYGDPALESDDDLLAAALEARRECESTSLVAARALIQSWDRDDLSLNPEDWHEALDNLRKATK